MGRVNRLMERRVLRRAADQALLTSLAQRPEAANQPGSRPDRDHRNTSTGSVDPDEFHKPDPITEPIPVTQAADVTPAVNQVRAPVRPRPPVEDAYVPPLLDFAMTDRTPWYRTKPAAAALAIAVLVAMLCGGWLLLRGPSTTPEQSTIEAPTSAAPTPSKAQPTEVSEPQPAPPPPAPPPPPPQAQSAEPVYSAPQGRYSEPQDEGPRTDVTRAPISVAPVPRPVGGSNSNTPGDAPKSGGRPRGCFGWC
jgi:hypothetical protein